MISEPLLLVDVQVNQLMLGQLKSPRHNTGKLPTLAVHKLFIRANKFKSLSAVHGLL